MHIENFDQLLDFTSAVISGQRAFEPITLADNVLVVPVKVDGDSWDKRMDIRHAHYVMTLQETLDSLIDELCPDIRDEDRPFVRVELREGSSDMLQYLTDFGKALVNDMTDKQKYTVAVLAILGACGTWGYTRYLDHLDVQSKSNVEIRQLEIHEQTKLAMLKPMLDAVELEPAKYAQYERPVAKLASMMEEGDQVALLGEGYISADIAKTKIKPKRTRSSVQVSSCDGEYTLLSTDYSLGELILHLEKDGVPIKAYTSVLDDETQRALFEEISSRQLEEALPFTLNLQMSVEHTDKKIKHGSIVGLGAPRADKEHKLLSDLAK